MTQPAKQQVHHSIDNLIITFEPTLPALPAREACIQAKSEDRRPFTQEELQPYIDGHKRFFVNRMHFVATDEDSGSKLHVVEFFEDPVLHTKARVREIGSIDTIKCNPRTPWLFLNNKD